MNKTISALKSQFRLKQLSVSDIPGAALSAEWDALGEGMGILSLTCDIAADTPIGTWQIALEPESEPDFFWTPHLTPDPDSVVDMHVFRTPALMMGFRDSVLCALPLVEDAPPQGARVFMDLDAPNRRMRLGLTTTEIYEHVLYRSTNRLVLPRGRFTFRIMIWLQHGAAAVANPFRAVLNWYWSRYGYAQCALLPAYEKLPLYVRRTYDWAFDLWEKQMWQEFTVDGVRVGAPQFIVNVFQSEGYKAPHSIREHVSIWNQAWFCSLRSAMGLYRYALANNDKRLLEKANMTKELALSFPQTDGLFDSVVAVPDEKYCVDGKEYIRGASWDRRYYGNSDRNPITRDLKSAPWHILDMSFTALHMLAWYGELDRDERLIEYVRRYSARLMALQDEKGYFPAWIDKATGKPAKELSESPESAVSASLLAELYRLTGDKAYLDSAAKCMDALCREVLPDGRWEDFETYWSCSGYGADMLGRRFPRNGIYKQCTLSPFYMADALLRLHEMTGDGRWLSAGQRCLDEMLMQQSSFQQAYAPIPVVGGFGVMNCDAELNDARQSLFAELIIRYGRALGIDEYVERGYAALRASFTMMYCPENPEVSRQWELRWPFFGPKDYGFMMENYGHGGYADTSLGIGEFAIYDWGAGAASEAFMRIDAHFGK